MATISIAKVSTSTAKVSTSAAKVPRVLEPTVESQFQCQSYSIPLQFKCDGTIHCVPDGSDEKDCPEAPTISSPTSIPLIRAPTNHKELRVEFKKDKKTAWKNCGKSTSKRERESVQQVNGVKTTIDKHPWVIVIKDEDDKLHCGGAIASSNRVISAGHCFVDQVSKKEMTKSQKQNFKVQVGTDIPFEYQAQQWRLTPEGKLQNRLRTWAYGKKNSTQIPSYGMKGIINITKKYGSKTILTFPAKGNAMKYREELPQRFKSSQLWDIGYPDNQGWFNISSSKAIGKYLTVTKIGYSNELTMEIEGTLY